MDVLHHSAEFYYVEITLLGPALYLDWNNFETTALQPIKVHPVPKNQASFLDSRLKSEFAFSLLNAKINEIIHLQNEICWNGK